jgi:hypothetical protein
MDTYTINKIYDDGRVDVTFSVDEKMQNIDCKNVITDKNLLHTFLSYYAKSYREGLAVENPVPDNNIIDIVGQAQAVE